MEILDYFPFTEFREHQRETLLKAQNILETKDNLIIQAPTGIGKSAMAITICKYFLNGFIVTNQKSLQNQYLRDFKKDIESVRGRSNFHCNINLDTCDVGQCILNKSYECECKPYSEYTNKPAAYSEKRGDLYWKCDYDEECPYWKQKTDALNSSIVVQNYAYFMTEQNYVKDFGKRIVLISDEGHNLEEHILSFVTITIDSKTLHTIQSDLEFIDFKNDIKSWNSWLEDLKNSKIHSRIQELDLKIEVAKEKRQEVFSISNKSKRDSEIIQIEEEIKLYLQINEELESLVKRINFYLSDSLKNPENWVIEAKKAPFKKKINEISFKPIKVDKYANPLYFQYGHKNIIMSATVLDHEMLIKRYGLDANKTGYINVPPIFPPENKRIYHLDIGELNRDYLDQKNSFNRLQAITDAVDTILEIYPEQKGIIHTTTYSIADFIKKNTRNPSRIIVHDRKDREKVQEEHQKLKNPTVLCSPSMTEGVDLKEDLSRFQILIKVPYANIGDPRIRKIRNTDKKYYNWLAAVDISQAIGRSVRSQEDWADTFTLDSRFIRFVKHNDSFLKDTFIPYTRPTKEFISTHRLELKKIMSKNKTSLKWLDENTLSY